MKPTRSFSLRFNSRPEKFTHFIKPMLAKLSDKAFDNPDWIFEIKWDGYRAIAELDGKNSRFYSRNGLSFAEEYTVIYDELVKIKKKAVIDGEVVALDDKGRPGFQYLQQYGQNQEVNLVYYVFDVLYINGKSVKDKPLLERKALLKKMLPESDIVRYCDHIEGQGIAFFDAMKKQGLEGMIAKRADSTYSEGGRSSEWLKIKHMLTDEAVIAGYTEPRGGRKYFGALVLGSYEKGKLIYIGHTGTGFDNKTLKDVYAKMQPLVTKDNPFIGKVRVNAPVTWVKPKLVCNLKFTEVTSEGSRRHPVFMGLRTDKAAKEVHSEAKIETEETEPVENRKAMKATTKKAVPQKTATKKAVKSKVPAKKSTAEKKTSALSGKYSFLTTDKQNKFTNPDKIYWPEEGYTKGDVIEYYNSVYKYIIPYLKGRPESLKRNPNGITGEAFFHKDAGEHAPDFVDTFAKFSESADKTIDYLVINNKPALLYVANLGCIEMNPWNSRVESPGNPDYLVLDLDPSDKNTFAQVVDCALVVKDVLDSAGIVSYCKTSGSTGLHVYVPLAAKYDYEQAKEFAHLVAQLTHEQLPDSTSLERSLSKRSKEHIYVDYLQNRQGQTLSSVYSLRPKPGAPVSTPLEWKEVKQSLDPVDFNIKNTLKRIEKKGDIFAPVLKKGIDMMKALKKLGG